ncbi:MAG: EamA family transporter [Candidatus Omnitrophica bacterium]|nr:EamA family transporter [Candidatus Omnitrophota bacterium]
MKKLTFRIFLLIIANDLVDTLAQLLMKKGVLSAGMTDIWTHNVIEFMHKGAVSPVLWLGIAVYVLNFFLWIFILARADLSVAMPVGSFCYIFIPMAAVIFLHESVSPVRWIGILFIILGIHFVARSVPAREGGH